MFNFTDMKNLVNGTRYSNIFQSSELHLINTMNVCDVRNKFDAANLIFDNNLKVRLADTRLLFNAHKIITF
jgi:hypothetical protein